MTKYIPEEGLPGLHKYKYSGIDKSLVSRYVLAPYWNNLIKLFPLWIAPNMITLLGLLTVVANVLTLFYYTSELGECPNWVYTTFGIGLFIYQSLDAIDGKQARRTQTSGPLGELFDHGCDALNTTLGVLTWASSTYLGQSWWTVASLTASLGNFYLSTWEEYHTGSLYLGYFSGPVEGVLMLCMIHLISGYFGPAFWMLRIHEVVDFVDFSYNANTRLIGSLQLNHVLIVIGGFVTFFNMISAVLNVIHVKTHPTETSKKDGSIFRALAGLFPFANMCFWAYQWLNLWPDIVTEHLALFAIFFGLLFGHQVGLMITAHVAKLRFPYFNVTVTSILLSGCLLAYFEDIVEE
ncbi:CDP-alcohol phosphatidyltransferase-domain-containing protein [Choanephora cucurbitarum]|nr:CDP-alcohol phosphatidyltransferase-domain-containing protein [Choanephora cucurbitarum]